MKRTKIIPIFMSIIMIVSMTACGKENDKVKNNSEEQISSSMVEINSSEVESSSSKSKKDKDNEVSSSSGGYIVFDDGPSKSSSKSSNIIGTKKKSTVEKINEAYNINNDVIGWLWIPSTTIDDPVLWRAGDNTFYEKKGLNKQYDWYGSYWADYECTFGGRDKLAKNTIIYGHSMDDKPDGTKFSQLKKLLNKDFATNHPYIYFSTTDEEMIWEIFMVGYVDTNLAYNMANPDTPLYNELLKELKMRSDFNYKVDVTTKDKILILSTCTYPNGLVDDIASQQTRYVVCAKLLENGAKLKDEAKLDVNINPKAPQISKK